MASYDPIGPYEILGEIGRGAHGIVYRARKATLPEREVALKVVPYGLDPRDRDRKRREARALLEIDCPHVVTLLDVFEHAERGALVLVMELLGAETLRDRLEREGALEVDAALEIADAILEALGALHDGVDAAGAPRPIVHRDLKPENVGFGGRRGCEVVKVMDFGVARILDADPAPSSTLTQLAFTPAYVAPEVVWERRATPASDLYALALILWEMLVGRHPFADDDGRLPPPALVQTRIAVQSVPALPPDVVPRVPEAMSDLIADLAARDPALRPRPREARARLDRARRGGPARSAMAPRPRSPRPIVGVFAAGLVALALVGFGLARTRRVPTATAIGPRPEARDGTRSLERPAAIAPAEVDRPRLAPARRAAEHAAARGRSALAPSPAGPRRRPDGAEVRAAVRRAAASCGASADWPPVAIVTFAASGSVTSVSLVDGITGEPLAPPSPRCLDELEAAHVPPFTQAFFTATVPLGTEAEIESRSADDPIAPLI